MQGWQRRALKDEISGDPLTRGYAGMSDSETADDLNTAYRDAPDVDVLSSGQIFDAIVKSEYEALSADDKKAVDLILGLGSEVLVGPGSNARAILIEAFGGQATATALRAIVTNQKQARGGELGLGLVTAADVAIARA